MESELQDVQQSPFCAREGCDAQGRGEATPHKGTCAESGEPCRRIVNNLDAALEPHEFQRSRGGGVRCAMLGCYKHRRDVIHLDPEGHVNQGTSPDQDKRVDTETLERLCKELLEAIGEDPEREGLRDTPRRWAAFWQEFIDYEPGKVDTSFAHTNADQMVCVKGLTVWTLCEHHLLPFSSTIAVGYIADKHVIGLSKIARIAASHAHRLQLQERLVEGIADDLKALAKTDDVAVVAAGEHLCMTMRGIKMPGSMVTSVMRGRFRTDTAMRAEFLRMVE